MIKNQGNCFIYGIGVYDHNAKCVEIVSHSGCSLRVVVVGPDILLSDDELKIILKEHDSQTKVLRLPTHRGLLLHRMLMPHPANWEEMRSRQVDGICCEVKIIPLEDWKDRTGHESVVQHSLFLPTMLPATAIAVGVILRLYLRRSAGTNVMDLHVLVAVCLGAGVVLGAIGAAVMMKLLKLPWFIVWTDMMSLQKVGRWSFNILSSGPGDTSVSSVSLASSSWSDPFVHLVFFLHGALGLRPSEVQYGNSTSAYDGEREVPLQYGGSYVIEVPTLDLSCAW